MPHGSSIAPGFLRGGFRVCPCLTQWHLSDTVAPQRLAGRRCQARYFIHTAFFPIILRSRTYPPNFLQCQQPEKN
jgi:hypothetical protein